MLDRTEEIKLNLMQQHLLGLIKAIINDLLETKRDGLSFFGALETLNEIERRIRTYLKSIGHHCVTKEINLLALNDIVEYVNHRKGDVIFDPNSQLATTVQTFNTILYSIDPTCLQSINGVITALKDFMPVHKGNDYRSFPRAEMSDIYMDDYVLYAYEEEDRSLPLIERDTVIENILIKYVKTQAAYWACHTNNNDILAQLLESLCYNKGQFNIMLHIAYKANNQEAIPLLISAHGHQHETSIFTQLLHRPLYYGLKANHKSLFTHLLSCNYLNSPDILAILQSGIQFGTVPIIKTILYSLNPQITACVIPEVIQDCLLKVGEEFKDLFSDALAYRQNINKLIMFFWFFKDSQDEDKEFSLPIDCIIHIYHALQSHTFAAVSLDPQIEENSAPTLG